MNTIYRQSHLAEGHVGFVPAGRWVIHSEDKGAIGTTDDKAITQLWAAAPDGLAALELCECELTLYRGLAAQSNNPQAWQDAIDAARAAIKHAKKG